MMRGGKPKMFLIKLAFKNLLRHKKRTLITAAVISLAIFFYLFLNSILMGMNDMAYRNVIDFESGHLQVVKSAYWQEREEMPLDNLFSPDNQLIAKIENSEGFTEMTGQLIFGARLNNGIDELPVMAKGINPESATNLFEIEEHFVAGSMFEPDEYKVVMGEKLANLMELNYGDYVTLLVRTKEDTFNTIEAEIGGLLNTPNPNLNQNVVYVPLHIAQQALNVDNQISHLIVNLNNKNKAARVAENLSGEIGTTFKTIPWNNLAEVKLTKAKQGGNQALMGIILLMAALGIINTVILSALERMEEIGMMKAMGLKVKEIVFTFVLEATGIGIIGGLAGCFIGAIAISLQIKYGIDFTVLFDIDMSSFGVPILGEIYGVWDLPAFIFVFAFAVIVSFVSSIFPSYWAARKDPVKAIYHR